MDGSGYADGWFEIIIHLAPVSGIGTAVRVPLHAYLLLWGRRKWREGGERAEESEACGGIYNTEQLGTVR